MIRAWLVACALAVAGPVLAQQPGSGTVQGQVLDQTGGVPIADVSVQVQGVDVRAATDADGRFVLAPIPSGPRELRVSVVGFVLVRRPIEVPDGGTLTLAIVLSEGTGTYTETLTVTSERFRTREAAVPAQHVLGSADILNLRNLLTNDPLRTVQALPGVMQGDDFRGEFAVRGSPFTRLNVTVDGIATPFLVHTVQQVRDGGSTAMLNGDVLGSLALMNGSYPQRFGNRLGAELAFELREGSRDRTQMRTAVSGTDASLVVEGPLAHRAGSWLVSARRSYLDLLLKQIDPDNPYGFAFSDAQARVVYDLSPRQRLDVSGVAGTSRLDQNEVPDGANELTEARNHGSLVNVGWRLTASPATVLSQRLAFSGNGFVNRAPSGFELERGAGQDFTWRADVVHTATPALAVEGGGQVQRQHRSLTSQRLAGATGVRPLQSFNDTAFLSSAYALARWTAGRFSASPGARVDHWSLTGDTASSPWVQAQVLLGGSLAIRAGAGVFRQFPDAGVATGTRGSAAVAPERAYHADLGLEQARGSWRWQVTLYNREERDLLRLPNADVRLVNGRVTGASTTSRWVNALDGYSRGIEWLVQRRGTGGLNGWISYSLGFNRYTDRSTGERFDGDFDQRHTFNAHLSYRLTGRMSVAAKLRAGSNFPLAGYWENRGGSYFVSAVRNGERIPAYRRLDVRGSRTFTAGRTRLTLFVELLNALGSDNRRFNVPSVNTRTGQVTGLLEQQIPRVPSAGLLVEF